MSLVITKNAVLATLSLWQRQVTELQRTVEGGQIRFDSSTIPPLAFDGTKIVLRYRHITDPSDSAPRLYAGYHLIDIKMGRRGVYFKAGFREEGGQELVRTFNPAFGAIEYMEVLTG